MPTPINPNFNYAGRPNYGYPNKKDQLGVLIGTLLGAGMGAASGQNTADSLLRGAEAGIFSYGTGLDKAQEYNTGALAQQSIADRLLYEPEQQAMERGMYDLNQKKYDQSVREYEEVEKPYRQSLVDNLLAKSSPEDIQYENEKKALDIKNKRLDIRGKSKELRLGKSPLVSVNTGAFETEEQKGMGRVAVGNYENTQKDAASARNELDIYNELESLMSQTDTGALEPFKTSLVSYSQSLGIPVSEKWDANQAIEAISNKLTIMARKAGEGQILAGQISDSDREFLKASVPSLGKMPGSNKLLIEMNKKFAQRKIESAKFAEDYYRKNGTLKGLETARDEWVNKNPLFSTTGGASNTEPTGSQTVPVDGVNYIIRDGKVYQP